MAPALTTKVIRFHPGDASRPSALLAEWAQGPAGPERPLRVTVGEPVRGEGWPEPRFAAVDIAWFADAGAALAHEARLAAAGPAPGTCTVVAEAVVVRGADRLRSRWEAGGDRFVMMSFGRRHPSLSAAEFSDRWRGHAGRLGGDTIPEDVRGAAYVQDHPIRDGGREWPFDAVNEVLLDDLAALARRRDWFATRPPAPAATPPLMAPGEAWHLHLVEHVVRPARR